MTQILQRKTVRIEAEDMEFLQKPGYGMCPKVSHLEGWVLFYNWDATRSLAGQAITTTVPVSGLYNIDTKWWIEHPYDFDIDTGIDVFVNDRKIGHVVLSAPQSVPKVLSFPARIKEGDVLNIVFMRSGDWHPPKFATGTLIDRVEFSPTGPLRATITRIMNRIAGRM